MVAGACPWTRNRASSITLTIAIVLTRINRLETRAGMFIRTWPWLKIGVRTVGESESDAYVDTVDFPHPESPSGPNIPERILVERAAANRGRMGLQLFRQPGDDLRPGRLSRARRDWAGRSCSPCTRTTPPTIGKPRPASRSCRKLSFSPCPWTTRRTGWPSGNLPARISKGLGLDQPLLENPELVRDRRELQRHAPPMAGAGIRFRQHRERGEPVARAHLPSDERPLLGALAGAAIALVLLFGFSAWLFSRNMGKARNQSQERMTGLATYIAEHLEGGHLLLSLRVPTHEFPRGLRRAAGRLAR